MAFQCAGAPLSRGSAPSQRTQVRHKPRRAGKSFGLSFWGKGPHGYDTVGDCLYYDVIGTSRFHLPSISQLPPQRAVDKGCLPPGPATRRQIPPHRNPQSFTDPLGLKTMGFAERLPSNYSTPMCSSRMPTLSMPSMRLAARKSPGGVANMPWNWREFVVKDCDGRLMAFAANLLPVSVFRLRDVFTWLPANGVIGRRPGPSLARHHWPVRRRAGYRSSNDIATCRVRSALGAICRSLPSGRP